MLEPLWALRITRIMNLVTADSFESRYCFVLDHNASTLTAYKLNLTGPSIDINTVLVAMHQAMNSLQAGDWDAALVGGLSVSFPQ